MQATAEPEPQESDEHRETAASTGLEPVIDDDTVELAEPIEPGEAAEETNDIPDDIETEEEINEPEVQEP